RGAALTDVADRRLGTAARRVVERRERRALGREVVTGDVVVREGEVAEPADGEDARRRLAELAGDAIGDADRGDLAADVVRRQVLADPPRGAAGCRRVARHPDRARLIVRQRVVRVPASLNHGELAGVVELLEAGAA